MGVWIGLRKKKYLYCIHVERRDGDTLIFLMCENMAENTMVVTDGWAAYSRLTRPQFAHDVFIMN